MIPSLTASTDYNYYTGDGSGNGGLTLMASWSYSDDYTAYMWLQPQGEFSEGVVLIEVSNINGTVETPLSILSFDDNSIISYLDGGSSLPTPQWVAVTNGGLFAFGTNTNYVLMDMRTLQYDLLALTCDSADTNAVAALSVLNNSGSQPGLSFAWSKMYDASGALWALPTLNVVSNNFVELVTVAPSGPTIIIDKIQIPVEFPTPLPFVPCCSLTCPC
jgi:hypothetical protein